MFTTIAWATDHSTSALDALPVAKHLAHQLGAKLAIIHVQEVTAGRGGVFAHTSQASITALHHTAEQLRGEGIEATLWWSRAPARDTAHAIGELAAKAGADLIIVGSRQYGPLAGLILRSVAQRLPQTASRPVLVVPPDRPPATPNAQPAA